MWGYSIPFWEAVFRWSTIGAFVLAGVAASAAFISTWVGAKLGDISQNEFDLKLTSAKAELAKANEAIASATATASTANLEAARLRLELDREIQKRAPRLLTDEQKSILVAELKGKISRIHLIVQRDVETEAYALQFVIALRDADVIVHPHKMPPGEALPAPAGVLMYRPGNVKTENDMKDDPLYISLKKAEIFGGYSGIPWLSKDQGPFGPLLPADQYALYIGQKMPW